MSGLLLLLRPFAWRIGAVGAGLGLLVVGALLVSAQLENRRVTGLNAVLDARINDPKTGYVVRLVQAETNTAVVVAGLNRQNAALKAKAELDAAKLAETERKLAAAQADSRAARRQAAELTARAPVGDTLEQRVLDVDAKILETLK